MKIRLGFRDKVKCVIEYTESKGITYSGEGYKCAQRIVRYYSRNASGKELLELLLKKLKGHWWAKEIEGSDTPDASLSTDAQGHEHKGKGPGGGQFVKKNKAGESASTRQEPAKITLPIKTRRDPKRTPFIPQPSLSEEEIEELDSLLEELGDENDENENSRDTHTSQDTSKKDVGIVRSIIDALSRLIGRG